MTPALLSSIRSMRPAVPAKDYAKSLAFYSALGFTARTLGPTLTELSLGPFSFLLQDFYVADYAGNFVMHMFVDDAEAWWTFLQSQDLVKRFDLRAPIAPRLEPWGLKVTYLIDPSGVLWQISSRP